MKGVINESNYVHCKYVYLLLKCTVCEAINILYVNGYEL